MSATIDVYTSHTYGIGPTDAQWPQIIAAIRKHGWTMTAINEFKTQFPANWGRGITTAVTTLFENSKTYASWVKDHKRNPTVQELGPLVAKAWADWSKKRCSTIIVATATLHGSELGAKLHLDDSLVASGKNAYFTVFYRSFNGLSALADPTDPTPSARATLPFNCQGLFGGVDATQGFFKGQGIRPNLFQLSGLDATDYLHQEVQWQGTDVSTAENHTASFDIPKYLSFVWDSRYHSQTVTGESKQEYQKNLSISMGLNASIDGFGMEMNDSFNETDFNETWKKYASIYERLQVYSLRMNEGNPSKLQKYLTERALDVFKSGSASDVVDAFGTHYMTSAVFGGLKRWSSTMDIRDDNVSEAFGQSLKIRVAETSGKKNDGKDDGKDAGGDDSGNKAPDSGGADLSNASETVKKLHSMLEVTTTDILGGTPDDSEKNWKISLYRNPSVVGYTLRNLADLILDPARAAAVQKEADGRMKKAGVTVDHKAQIMFHSFAGVANDQNSGSHTNIATARMARKQGWYSLGQYARGPDPGVYNWDISDYQGLLIRDIPGAETPLIVRPTGVSRAWGQRAKLKCGLFEMTGPAGYVALSGGFFSNDSASADDFEDAGMVHEAELTLPAEWDKEIWNDHGTGANDDGSAWSVKTGAFDDARARILIVPDKGESASLFHSRQGYGRPDWTPRKLDLSKCKLLKNQFL